MWDWFQCFPCFHVFASHYSPLGGLSISLLREGRGRLGNLCWDYIFHGLVSLISFFYRLLFRSALFFVDLSCAAAFDFCFVLFSFFLIFIFHNCPTPAPPPPPPLKNKMTSDSSHSGKKLIILIKRTSRVDQLFVWNGEVSGKNFLILRAVEGRVCS